MNEVERIIFYIAVITSLPKVDQAMKVNVFCPFLIFFSTGEARLGLATLLMQLSLVLWPAAIQRARNYAHARGMQRMLDELSLAHRRVDLPPNKRFRAAPAA